MIVRTFKRFFSNSVKFTFIKRDGTKQNVEAQKGQHLLEIAKANDV